MSIAPCPGSAFAGEDPQRLSKLPGAGRLKIGDFTSHGGIFCPPTERYHRVYPLVNIQKAIENGHL